MADTSTRKPWVYIAGPISKGDPFANVRTAVQIGEKLRRRGIVPIIPHLSALWAMIGSEATYEDWLELDFELISRCDAVLRIPGESPGADREVMYALDLGKPIYLDWKDVA